MVANLLRRLPVVALKTILKPPHLDIQVLWASLRGPFPQASQGVPMVAKFFQCLVEDIEGLQIRGGRFGFTQFESFGDSTFAMGFVGMTVENIRLPCLKSSVQTPVSIETIISEGSS